jgi:hypothetical protein
MGSTLLALGLLHIAYLGTYRKITRLNLCKIRSSLLLFLYLVGICYFIFWINLIDLDQFLLVFNRFELKGDLLFFLFISFQLKVYIR